MRSQSLLRQGERSDDRRLAHRDRRKSQSLLRQGERSDDASAVAEAACNAVSIPSSSGRAFGRSKMRFSRGRSRSQSLLRQGERSDTSARRSSSPGCSSLNPFFVRASVRTNMAGWSNANLSSQSLLRQGERSDRPVSRTNALSTSCDTPCAAAWCSAEPASESGPSFVGLSKSIGHHAKWMPLASRLLP